MNGKITFGDVTFEISDEQYSILINMLKCVASGAHITHDPINGEYIVPEYYGAVRGEPAVAPIQNAKQ
jgi:hypothetical protein